MNLPPLSLQRITLWIIALSFLAIGLVGASYVGYLYDQKTASDVLVVVPPRATPTYLVISVIDGDTFNVLMNGKKQTVRLIAVDAPESNHPTKPIQCFSLESKHYLEALIKDKYVSLEREVLDNDRDRYNRLLRYAFIDNINVNEMVLKNGYAVERTYVEGYKYSRLFKQAQKYAKESRLGLWASDTCGGNVNVGSYLEVSESSGSSTGCDCTKTCSVMKTCEEATFQLNVCKCVGRDTDGNGIPCEGLCK